MQRSLLDLNAGDVVKSITVSQPWANLIASGEKWIENRRWKFTCKHRGLLAIHAGKGTQYLTAAELKGYPGGCVVAIVDMVGAEFLDDLNMRLANDKIGESDLTVGDVLGHRYTEGPMCMIFDPKKTITLPTPSPAIGSLGLWDFQLTQEVIDVIRNA